MRRLVVIGLVCLCAFGAYADSPWEQFPQGGFPRQGFPQQNFQQPQQRFSPEKYQADLEQYITKEACLTPKEAAAFFPLLREMQKKQRALYNKMREDVRIKPTDEAACKKMIQKHDQLELELKSIQQTYHNKFFSVIPASKVFDVIRAEDKTLYHAAAVTASNLAVALMAESINMLCQCGFDEADARKALTPLVTGNVHHVLVKGPAEALTGPVERGDAKTIAKHLGCLDERQRELYRVLSSRLIPIAESKHPDRLYQNIKDLLDEDLLNEKLQNQEL